MTLKSAMTPSFIGLMATMLPGVRPSISLASLPTASTSLVFLLMRDDGGLIDDDALAARVDQSIRGAEINGQVARKHAEQGAQIVEARGSIVKSVI